jgi:Ca2+-binding RTX toxin-like protein
VTALLIAGGVVPEIAAAGSAASIPPTLLVGENTADEENDLVLTETGGKFRIGEVFAFPLMTAGPGCAPAGADVDCDVPGIDDIAVFTHGNDDTVQQNIDLPATLSGGAGGDGLFGGPRADTVEGDTGSDLMSGGGGNDYLSDGTAFFGANGNDEFAGGGGDDLMDGGTAALNGAGSDTFTGGPGIDTLTMLERSGPVTITEDSVPNDGEGGEGDNVVEAEIFLLPASPDRVTVGGPVNLVNGGDGADTIAGGGGADQLFGAGGGDALDGDVGPDLLSGGLGTDSASFRPRSQPVTVTVGDGPNDGEAGEGDDVLDDVESVLGGSAADNLGGGDGAETLDGGAGGDTVNGAGGDDRLVGGEGPDTATGNSGDDSLDGGEGVDDVSGGSGDDSIEARDGTRDTIVCGTGEDSVSADPDDDVAADCESRATPGVAPDTAIGKPTVKKRKATIALTGTGGTAPLSFECALDGKPFAPCESPVVLRHLRRGRHTFAARARDSAGLLDQTPAERSFKIKRRRRKS